MGISVLQMKVLVAALAAFVAGIGGAMYALSLGTALPSNYSTLGGLVWLAVLVTLGIRSNVAALIAGLSTTLLAGIALVYLPSAFAQVTPILFGLGAIQVAKFPNGIMTENARQVLWAWGKVRSVSRSKRSPDAGPPVVVGGELS
jgi:branched-chain amino acid transport system permease protein